MNVRPLLISFAKAGRGHPRMSEREERLEEALWRIAQWAEAYPLSVFPEPSEEYYRKAHEVLTANGMTLDRLSAASMRHVIEGVGKIARDALSEERTSAHEEG